MSSSNLFVQLRRQLAPPALQVGDVIGGSTAAWLIELPGGGRITARGQASIGQRVWVRGDVIEGTAPSLPIVPATV